MVIDDGENHEWERMASQGGGDDGAIVKDLISPSNQLSLFCSIATANEFVILISRVSSNQNPSMVGDKRCNPFLDDNIYQHRSSM